MPPGAKPSTRPGRSGVPVKTLPSLYELIAGEANLAGRIRPVQVEDLLGRDTIDFYQLHNPRMDALQDDDLWTYLDGLLQAGTVRSIGIALGPAIGWRDEEAALVADKAALLAGRQRHLFESLQFAHGPRSASGLLVDVDLDHFFACPRAGVFQIH